MRDDNIDVINWCCVLLNRRKANKRQILVTFLQGEDGVRQVLQILKDEFRSTMVLAGWCILWVLKEHAVCVCCAILTNGG